MLSHDDYTVAIVCALSIEMIAVRAMFDQQHSRLPRKEGDSNTYHLGRLCGHNVVLAGLPGTQGKGAAAIVATNLARTFPRIQWRLLVGIGGGVPSARHDLRLGDVVVSMPEGTHGGVVQYDLGKAQQGGFQRKGFLAAPPPELRQAVLVMQAERYFRQPLIPEYLSAMLQRSDRFGEFARPPAASDVLFDAAYAHVATDRPGCEACDRTRTVVRAARGPDPAIHYGLIASGDLVIRSAAERDARARAAGGDVLCFEMEAAGLLAEFPCLVIRGISDYADAHKNDAWHHYAAAVAAACAKELLTFVEARPDDLEASSSETSPVPGPRRDARGPGSVYSTFHGHGINNVGGNVSVGGDLNIGGR